MNQTTGRRDRVLVVDDDPVSRLLVVESLDQAGFRVLEADCGTDAIGLLPTFRPDVVLLDIVMPGLDGFATCAEIRKRPHGADTLVVMMTGLDDAGSVFRAFQSGATSFITKPINALILLYQIRHLLGARQTVERLRTRADRYATAQQIARLGCWEWRPGCQPEISEGLLALLGLPDADLGGVFRRFLAMVDARDRGRAASAFRSLRRRNEAFRFQHRIADAEGRERILYQECRLMPDGRVIGIVQDITDYLARPVEASAA